MALTPTHLIADLRCTKGLDKPDVVEAFTRETITLTRLTIRKYHAERFGNGSEFGPGTTVIVLLSESHMVVHTAPERRMLNVDLYSCREFDAGAVRGLLERLFAPDLWYHWEVLKRH